MPLIPTNLITGFLGVGKTTAVIDLLKHKTSGERWAVLVNEYGDVSIDGAMIEGSSPDGVTVREVGGGCVCCASAPYLPVALHFLLLDAKPDRLIIETTGLGHPARLLDTLRTNYADRLDVRAVLGIVDPADFAKPEMRDNPVFIDQIQLADVVVMNKLDTATPELVADFQKWANGLFPPKLLIAGTTYGRLDTAWLDLTANDERLPLYPEAHGHSPSPPNPLSPRERGSEYEESESATGTHHASFSPSPTGRGGWGVRADFSGEDESQRLSELAGRDRHLPELLLQRARELRWEQTTAEQFLWDCLRDRQLSNSKFRCQHNVGPYIADFYCHSARLCIELDGGVHDIPDQQEKDRVRDQWMRENGFVVLRFRNEQVLEEPVTALQRIVDALTPPPPFQTALTPQPPLPVGEGEREAKCAPTTHSSSLPLSHGERGQGGEGAVLPLSPGERGRGGEGGLKPGHPIRYPSPPGVHPACCGWLFTPDDVFDEGKLLGLLGRTQGITRLKGVFRLTDEWAMVNRAGTAVSVAPTAYRRDSRLEIFAEGLDWLTFEQGLLDCLVI